jgi:hypothetical protein
MRGEVSYNITCGYVALGIYEATAVPMFYGISVGKCLWSRVYTGLFKKKETLSKIYFTKLMISSCTVLGGPWLPSQQPSIADDPQFLTSNYVSLTS